MDSSSSGEGHEYWSESDTLSLIKAWGKLCLQLNYTGLRLHHWQQVAQKVNKGHVRSIQWSDTQCRNRVDTLERTYKVEKSHEADGYVSTWRVFKHLDFFIGPVFKHYTTNTPLPAREVERNWFPANSVARGVSPVVKVKRKMFPEDEAALGVFTPPQELTRESVVMTERKWLSAARGVVSPQELKGAPVVTTARGVLPPPQELTRDSVVMTEQKCMPAVTTARGVVPPPHEWKGAPAVTTAHRVLPPPVVPVGVGVVTDDPDSDMNMEMWRASGGKRNADVKLKGNVNGRRRVEKKVRDECGQLVEAIERFVEVYEKVEEAKRRQLVELEKQRMMFIKDLEIQRMRLLMESQLQFQKLMKSESDIFKK